MNNEEIAISVKNLSKSFRLPHERISGIKQGVINLFRNNRGYEEQKVLDNISFDIKKGEFFGIVGRNGSGKSTLLKILAGIYTPDSGSVHINGSLTPFIELGVGFNPELTGRENVFLNGALLGFSRKEMAEMYDDIVEFAELERFMDQKLKNYSSGMQVRLAFSIAIRAQGGILLLDEVLAVGDEAFQKKCNDYFRTIKNQGKTVVLVTHNMEAVREFCNNALMLECGKIKTSGKPTEVAASYSLGNTEPAQTKEGEREYDPSKNKSYGIQVIGVNMDRPEATYSDGDTISFSIQYKLVKKLDFQLGISITKKGSSVFEKNTKDIELPNKPGNYTLKWWGSTQHLTAGLHQISVAAFRSEGFQLIAYLNDATSFIVNKQKKGGMLDMDSRWETVNE